AVSGFAGAVNPEHELEVKRILRDETGLFVTCGHELSDLLNFKTRAQTAVLNARIIPRLAKLLEDLEAVLLRRGIKAPIVVVKGDGSLVSKEVALERPVETILSGPAASVAGARYLTRRKNAIVVDMGGTTTDTAMLHNGSVRLCATGSNVGGFKTHVKALEIRTTGLGGDSFIAWHHNEFEIGPRRVAPMAWLGMHAPDTHRALDFLVKQLDEYRGSTRPLQILTQTAHTDGTSLTAPEAEIVRLLRERPCSLQELAARTDAFHRGFLPLARLEENFIIQRCGLTPTDLLNASDGFDLWNKKASRRMCEIFSAITGIKIEELVADLLHAVVKKLALEILRKQLDEKTDPDKLHGCEAAQMLIANWLNGGGPHFSVKVKMHRPVIGIGAPVHYFLSRAAALLGAEAIFPEHAEVANAIGAITSHIKVQRQVRIKPDAESGFIVEGLAGAKQFADLDQATAYAEKELVRLVRAAGRMAGTSALAVELNTEDQVPATSTGSQVFLARTITAQLIGKPDKVRI
ncbi:MAG: hydantoinase/oxoprolinase family protein, partial [Desulfobacterales bacterium]